MKTPEQILALALEHERIAVELRKQAKAASEYEMFEPDVRLVFSSTERCSCGAGLAYDQVQDIYWSCSDVLLGKANGDKHRVDLPHCIHGFEVEDKQSTRPKC